MVDRREGVSYRCAFFITIQNKRQMKKTDKQSVSIRMLYLEKLLTEACELLIILADCNIATDDDKKRINALFNEIKYNEELDSEIMRKIGAYLVTTKFK